MNRRDFLKRSGLISLGGILLPSVLVPSCRKETLLQDVSFSGKVIVIGAGASGLYAGYILKSKGIDYNILEATSTHGGRMGKLTGFADYTIDTGAQWMHGNNSILADLVRSTGTTITRDDSELTYWFNNQLVSELPSDPFIFEGQNLPDISFKDYAHQQGLDSRFDNIVEAIAGDQGASASALSAYWNSKDEENWVSGDEDYKFRSSYFDLINDHIASHVADRITYNCPVTEIDYGGDRITVRDGNGGEWICDKLIITVPVSILKMNAITFIPALPAEKTAAISGFGMGPGMKVFLKFSSAFYDAVTYGGSVCGAYADDTLGKITSDHVLLAFVMGDQAAALNALGNDTAITNALLQELDTMYGGQATATFINSSVHNYTNMPFIQGAYSYSTIGMDNARNIAAQPVNNKLYFAGEAMNTNGHHQTVHGAVEAGYNAVISMLSALDQ